MLPSLLDILYLLFAGALGGFLSGVFGVGGGIIFIPILDVVLSHYGIETDIVKFLLANSMTAIVFTGVYNSYKQYKANNYFFSYVLATAIPGVMSSLLCTYFIEQGTWYDKKTFNLVFAALLVPSIVRMIAKRKHQAEHRDDIPWHTFLPIGFLTGIFAAFSGLGGGIVMIPAFVNYLKMEMKKGVSVSAGVVPFFAIITTLFYMWQQPSQPVPLAHVGYVIYPVVLPMIAGVLMTVPLGVRTGHRMNPVLSKTIFAIMGILIIIKSIYENFN